MIIFSSTGQSYITQVDGGRCVWINIQVMPVGVDSVVDWVFIYCGLYVMLLMLFLIICMTSTNCMVLGLY